MHSIVGSDGALPLSEERYVFAYYRVGIFIPIWVVSQKLQLLSLKGQKLFLLKRKGELLCTNQTIMKLVSIVLMM